MNCESGFFAVIAQDLKQFSVNDAYLTHFTLNISPYINGMVKEPMGTLSNYGIFVD